jgi:hypothetical protein
MATSQTQPEPVQTALEAARSDRRRRVIQELDAAGGEMELGDLTDALAKIEYGNGVSDQERKRVYVGLYQSHVPKLADLGLVRFDESNVVSPTPDLFRVASWLRWTRERFAEDSDDGV